MGTFVAKHYIQCSVERVQEIRKLLTCNDEDEQPDHLVGNIEGYICGYGGIGRHKGLKILR